MAKYDGPSFFKNEHPKIKPIDREKRTEKEANSTYALPDNVPTRKNIQKEASHFMQTPSKKITKDPPPERFPFKRTHVPASLQRLDGWANQKKVNPIFLEVQERLETKEEDFLLFEAYLSDEMKEKLKKKETVPVHTPSVVKEKALVVQKEMTKSVMKPGTGLHRSLSNIMDDEQKTISKNKNSLNKLFHSEEKSKKDKTF